MTERFADVGRGVRLAYEVHGEPTAPIVIPILGITDNLTDWPVSFCEPFLAAGFCVIRHELRDMGHSSEPDADYTLDDMARDVAGLMTALGIVEASLIGYSLGGAIAQLLALEMPRRVRRLVALQSTTYDPRLPPRSTAVLEAMAAASRPHESTAGAVAALRGLRLACNGRRHAMTSEEAQASAELSVARAYRPAGTARMIRARQRSAPFFERIGGIRCPTLVLQGSDDPIFPPGHGADIANRIVGARLVELEGAGHNHPQSLVPEMLRTIVEFLS